MKSREQKIIEQDDRLLRKERSWRRAFVGSIFLAIMTGVALFVTISETSVLKEKDEIMSAIGGHLLFWMLIAGYCDLRLRHIKSIKFYRSTQSEDRHNDSC